MEENVGQKFQPEHIAWSLVVLHFDNLVFVGIVKNMLVSMRFLCQGDFFAKNPDALNSIRQIKVVIAELMEKSVGFLQ
jgi:hypothetical protein